MKKIKEGTKGITLIALVVTIIVMLILAGIAITLSIGDNGLFTRAFSARKEHEIGEILEKLEMEKESALIDKSSNITIGEYLEHIKNENIINDEDVEDTGDEKSKIIIVDDYAFLVEEENDGNIKITYEGEAKKRRPSLRIEVTKITTNSITVKATAKRMNNGKYSYYIKDIETGEEYVLKKTGKEDEYKFEGLVQNKEYQIKVKAENEYGEIEKESNKIRTTELEALIQGNITFEYSPAGWSSKITVTAKVNQELQEGSHIETSKNAKDWEETDKQEFTENGTMYVRIYDGVNQSNYGIAQVDKIDSNPPDVTITVDQTTNYINGKIKAKVKVSDSQSGINLSKSKWVINSSETPLGTTLSSYTGGTLTKAEQDIASDTKTATGTYYIHVLATDNAGKTQEKVVSAQIKNGYAISTPTQFQNIKNNLSANYYVINDIDMSGFNFTRIEGAFTGSLNGQGYTISNLKITNTLTYNQTGGHYTGIFKEIAKPASISNMLLKNVNISSASGYVGVIAGTVKVIQGDSGISIDNVGITGSIKGTGNVGSFIGHASETANTPIYIRNCYARVNIDSTSHSAGIIGIAWTVSSSTTIQNSYWIGTNSAAQYKSSLIYGSPINIKNAYYDNQKYTGESTGTGLTTAQTKQQSSYSGFDFVNTWYMGPDGYPELKFN